MALSRPDIANILQACPPAEGCVREHGEIYTICITFVHGIDLKLFMYADADCLKASDERWSKSDVTVVLLETSITGQVYGEMLNDGDLISRVSYFIWNAFHESCLGILEA